MRGFVCTCLTLAALTVFLMSTGNLWAKGGRGGSIGGRGKGFSGGVSSRGNTNVGKKFSDSFATGNRKLTSKPFTQPNTNRGFARTGDQPWDKHSLRELRKLDHSRQVADHLRRVSDQNGNEQLKRVADDMDRRSQAHYDKQMEKIRQKYGLEDTSAGTGNAPDNGLDNSLNDSNRASAGSNDPADEVAQKLTGRDNALYRQLRNEQRKLDKRLQMVDQMREMANANGDQAMLENADRLEEWANNHFDKRMAQVTDFQDRHGLAAIEDPLSP